MGVQIWVLSFVRWLEDMAFLEEERPQALMVSAL